MGKGGMAVIDGSGPTPVSLLDQMAIEQAMQDDEDGQAHTEREMDPLVLALIEAAETGNEAAVRAMQVPQTGSLPSHFPTQTHP